MDVCQSDVIRLLKIALCGNQLTLFYFLIPPLPIQAKNEVRKLFVNICRVRPDRCLDLLNAVMSAQPQPFSAGELLVLVCCCCIV